MRVLLKHSLSGYYYMGGAEWTTEPRDAGDFHNIEQALRMIVQDKLDQMSVAIRYDESGAEQIFDLSRDIPAIRTEKCPPGASES